MPLAGGKITEVARGSLPGPVYYSEHGKIVGFRITSVLPTRQGIFIGDFLRGILVARDGKITAWTEKEGLASDQIWSLGWANDTLYAGADNGFLSVDPKTGRCRILASGKSDGTGNPLDGGTAYRIANILASPDSKSLWLAVGGDQTRLGVWRYDLVNGRLDHVVHTSHPSSSQLNAGPSVTWHDGKLLILTAAGDYFPSGLFDPNSGALIIEFKGNGVLSETVQMDRLYDERTDKNLSGTGYASQNGVVLTPMGFITEAGSLIPSRKEEFTQRFPIGNSHIATPALVRQWQTVQEVGSGFVAASYDAPPYLETRKNPSLWYFTPGEQAKTQPATTPQDPAPARP